MAYNIYLRNVNGYLRNVYLTLQSKSEMARPALAFSSENGSEMERKGGIREKFQK